MKLFWKQDKKLPEEADETRSLIERAMQGDRDAFEEIARRYEKRIFWVAFSITSNFHDAQDVTQEVLLKVFRNIGKLKNEDGFTTWLYRITVHESWDFMREFRLVPLSGEPEAAEEEKKERSAAESFEDKEFRENLLRYLKVLAKNEKTVFILRDIEGLEVKKIAKVMNISRITVRRHLSNARSKLRGKLTALYPGLKGRLSNE